MAARAPVVGEPMCVGVLALQGDFAAHERLIAAAGHRPVAVRTAESLSSLDALVLPGGESSTMLKCLHGEGLMRPLEDFCRSGRPVLGTCAGAILLAREVTAPSQDSLGVLDVTIERNGYGRQLQSFVGHADQPLHPELARADTSDSAPGAAGADADASMELVFIRAPVIRRTGPDVDVLVTHDGRPVAVRTGALVATTFHPELSGDGRLLALTLAGATAGTADPVR